MLPVCVKQLVRGRSRDEGNRRVNSEHKGQGERETGPPAHGFGLGLV